MSSTTAINDDTSISFSADSASETLEQFAVSASAEMMFTYVCFNDTSDRPYLAVLDRADVGAAPRCCEWPTYVDPEYRDDFRRVAPADELHNTCERCGHVVPLKPVAVVRFELVDGYYRSVLPLAKVTTDPNYDDSGELAILGEGSAPLEAFCKRINYIRAMQLADGSCARVRAFASALRDTINDRPDDFQSVLAWLAQPTNFDKASTVTIQQTIYSLVLTPHHTDRIDFAPTVRRSYCPPAIQFGIQSPRSQSPTREFRPVGYIAPIQTDDGWRCEAVLINRLTPTIIGAEDDDGNDHE